MNQTERETRTRNKRIATYFATLAVIAIAIAVYTVLDRLTEEALAVLAGATCGVAAAIPTSLLIVAVSRRDKAEQPRAQMQAQPRQQQGTYPPIVIVAPQGTQQHQLPGRPGWGGGGVIMDQPPTERHFTVVGGDLDD